jgi:hypothetical protein
MAVGVKEVDRVDAVGGVRDIRAMTHLRRNVDKHVATLPAGSAIVREGVEGLKLASSPR